MCGVVSIVYENNTPMLGNESAMLLKKLEYRGYDSTGGVYFTKSGEITLRKKVGAPSVIVEKLELEKMSGQKFIGQVRWATYGAVTDSNAQPHEVKCHIHIAGAHNGNISNTDTLKEFLIANGHKVVSDNDGEMLVHLVEHFYAIIMKEKKPADEAGRILAMTQAIRDAQKMVKGSYAACVTAPDITGVFAMKSGSSLYAGKGHDGVGDFIVVSSDLTSVLSKTRFLIPLSEGDGLYFTHNEYKVFSLSGNKENVPHLVRSRLNIGDIALQPRYKYFMEQEIHSSPENIDLMLRYYFVSDEEKGYFPIFEAAANEIRELLYSILKLYDVFDAKEMRSEFAKLTAAPAFRNIIEKVRPVVKASSFKGEFVSEESALLTELFSMDEKAGYDLHIIDLMIVWKKKRTVVRYKERLVGYLQKSKAEGGRVFIVASGTSYHAALVAGYFFNNISNLGVIPANPGLFRSLYIDSLSQRDIIIGVSQSGETKDLVDIFNDIKAKYGKELLKVTIVNNENSTLPQEKSDFYLPVLCGPEIAVAATKSFISQTALFYILASSIAGNDAQTAAKLGRIRYFIDSTIKNTDNDITEIALRLFLKPSMHILGTSLIGLAKEGALKIREVVLNHTEGYDSAEFKHGPNTILGKNTIYSFSDMEKLHADIMKCFELINETGNIAGMGSKEKLRDFLNLVKCAKFTQTDEDALALGDPNLTSAYQIYTKQISVENYFSSYPLIFVCPPDERDKRITISQIHTHKIRGADIILIAEEDEELKKAVTGKPEGFDDYFSEYITVPKTGDRNIFSFEAAVVLQTLSLKMSIAKMKYLNRNRVENHGVHPDVPKNVSKSITVD